MGTPRGKFSPSRALIAHEHRAGRQAARPVRLFASSEEDRRAGPDSCEQQDQTSWFRDRGTVEVGIREIAIRRRGTDDGEG